MRLPLPLLMQTSPAPRRCLGWTSLQHRLHWKLSSWRHPSPQQRELARWGSAGHPLSSSSCLVDFGPVNLIPWHLKLTRTTCVLPEKVAITEKRNFAGKEVEVCTARLPRRYLCISHSFAALQSGGS